MNKTVYLGLLTLKLSKIIMYEFCYGCIKPKYGGNAIDHGGEGKKAKDIKKCVIKRMFKFKNY